MHFNYFHEPTYLSIGISVRGQEVVWYRVRQTKNQQLFTAVCDTHTLTQLNYILHPEAD